MPELAAPELYIESINVKGRTAITNTGQAVPITNLFDGDGKETEDPEQALSFVAGSGGIWFSGLCRDFKNAKVH